LGYLWRNLRASKDSPKIRQVATKRYTKIHQRYAIFCAIFFLQIFFWTPRKKMEINKLINLFIL
jgi:hypothetical protein